MGHPRDSILRQRGSWASFPWSETASKELLNILAADVPQFREMLAGWSDDWHPPRSGLCPNSPDDETNAANRSTLKKPWEAVKQSTTTLFTSKSPQPCQCVPGGKAALAGSDEGRGTSVRF